MSIVYKKEITKQIIDSLDLGKISDRRLLDMVFIMLHSHIQKDGGGGFFYWYDRNGVYAELMKEDAEDAEKDKGKEE